MIMDQKPQKEALKLSLKVDQKNVQDNLREFVRGTVEETLNSMLDAEADALCGAGKYERSPDRTDTRAGSYNRKLQTQAGEVELKVPKLRQATFETQVIERYRRRECSVEEALVEMYLAGVSVRRVEDITEALWGTKVSSSAVSRLNKKIYAKIDEWLNAPIETAVPYVYLDGIWLKRSWGGEVTNVAVLVAIGVDSDGFRRILGVREGMKEDHESWLAFLRHLKTRGLDDPRLIISDKCLGLVEAAGEVFPNADWQRCMVHFMRNVKKEVPKHRVREVMDMLRAIFAQEDRIAAEEKAGRVVAKLRERRLNKAADVIEEGISETFTFYKYPSQHWRRIRTNNPLERMNREIRRRTKVVGNFPDGKSALMLVAARLRYLAGTSWGSKRYLDMSLLIEEEEPDLAA
jgi:transposase-like protein